jgi:hypothetical protein
MTWAPAAARPAGPLHQLPAMKPLAEPLPCIYCSGEACWDQPTPQYGPHCALPPLPHAHAYLRRLPPDSHLQTIAESVVSREWAGGASASPTGSLLLRGTMPAPPSVRVEAPATAISPSSSRSASGSPPSAAAASCRCAPAASLAWGRHQAPGTAAAGAVMLAWEPAGPAPDGDDDYGPGPGEGWACSPGGSGRGADLVPPLPPLQPLAVAEPAAAHATLPAPAGGPEAWHAWLPQAEDEADMMLALGPFTALAAPPLDGDASGDAHACGAFEGLGPGAPATGTGDGGVSSLLLPPPGASAGLCRLLVPPPAPLLRHFSSSASAFQEGLAQRQAPWGAAAAGSMQPWAMLPRHASHNGVRGGSNSSACGAAVPLRAGGGGSRVVDADADVAPRVGGVAGGATGCGGAPAAAHVLSTPRSL